MRTTHIKQDADGYAIKLKKEYNNPESVKYRRVEQIMDYVSGTCSPNTIETVLDVGCGPGFISKRVAKSLNCVVDAVDFSEKELKNANALIAKSIKEGELFQDQVSLFKDNVLYPRTSIKNKKYDLVLCIDTLASYKRPEKKELVKRLIDYKFDKGSILLTALCCEDDVLTERYLQGKVINYRKEGKLHRVPLFSEPMEFYESLFEELVYYRVPSKRLDKTCVLFEIF